MSISSGSLDFLVPEGYVMVPKIIRLFPRRLLTIVDASGTYTQEIFMDFLVNGAGVPQNTNIPVRLTGAQQDFPLYFVLPILGVFTVQLRTDTTLFNDITQRIAITVGANLILSDGGPTEYQIAGTRREAETLGGNVVFSNKGVP